eukprot:TRINITY_DN35931_c0_g1_i1.p1 TRINITY_DN35931_c0_g1~~TRINITY_DN35931_c0_g1_i1.p1  ORF type:complete len:462 (+),score=136.52 TRINITY_DN35931_c0_g1_i1:58-1443(+)
MSRHTAVPSPCRRVGDLILDVGADLGQRKHNARFRFAGVPSPADLRRAVVAHYTAKIRALGGHGPFQAEILCIFDESHVRWMPLETQAQLHNGAQLWCFGPEAAGADIPGPIPVPEPAAQEGSAPVGGQVRMGSPTGPAAAAADRYDMARAAAADAQARLVRARGDADGCANRLRDARISAAAAMAEAEAQQRRVEDVAARQTSAQRRVEAAREEARLAQQRAQEAKNVRSRTDEERAAAERDRDRAFQHAARQQQSADQLQRDLRELMDAAARAGHASRGADAEVTAASAGLSDAAAARSEEEQQLAARAAQAASQRRAQHTPVRRQAAPSPAPAVPPPPAPGDRGRLLLEVERARRDAAEAQRRLHHLELAAASLADGPPLSPHRGTTPPPRLPSPAPPSPAEASLERMRREMAAKEDELRHAKALVGQLQQQHRAASAGRGRMSPLRQTRQQLLPVSG